LDLSDKFARIGGTVLGDGPCQKAMKPVP
jgi:hypothetical protein